MTDDNFVNISGGNVQGFIQQNHGTVNQNFITQYAESISEQPPDAEKLTPEESRQRKVLLSKVKQYWIEGVLEKSLHTKAMIALGLEKRSDAVEPPFQGFEELPEESRQSLATGTGATEFFNQLGEGRTLLILGHPGAGKTITLLKLAQELIVRTQEDPSRLIPVVFNLSSWGSKQQTIADWLVQELRSKYEVPQTLGKDWVKKEQLILLLDGLDEVKLQHRESCLVAINQFIQDHGQTEMVVCSRIKDYEALSNRLRLRGAICIRPLTSEQVNQYLDAASEQLQAVKTLLEEDRLLRKSAKSPLILSVITLACKNKKIEEVRQTGSLKERRQHLFDAYIEQMFRQEIRGKPREYNSPYQNQQTKLWLKWLAQHMSQAVFQIEEMQPESLLSEKEKIIYRIATGLTVGLILGLVAGMYFIYFYAIPSVITDSPDESKNPIELIAIGVLSGLIPGIIAGLLSPIPNTLIKGIISGTILAISISILGSFYPENINITPRFLYAILGGVIFSSIDPRIQPVENIEFDLNKMIKYAIFFGILGGVSSYIQFFYLIRSEKQFYDKIYAVYVVIVFIIVGVFRGGFRIQKDIIDKKAIPNQGIKRSLSYTVIAFFALMFFAIFVAWGMDFKFVWNPALIYIGLVVGLLGGLGTNESSGVVCIQHLVLRVILWLKGNISWNYARFLNYASDRIFLQKVGGGYIFVHRMLLEHFARR
jgi:hypothetical protein